MQPLTEGLRSEDGDGTTRVQSISPLVGRAQAQKNQNRRPFVHTQGQWTGSAEESLVYSSALCPGRRAGGRS